jgi:hypothetical protein
MVPLRKEDADTTANDCTRVATVASTKAIKTRDFFANIALVDQQFGAVVDSREEEVNDRPCQRSFQGCFNDADYFELMDRRTEKSETENKRH